MKKIVISLLEYLFVFLIILEFNTVYYIFSPVSSLYRNYSLVILLILFFIRSGSCVKYIVLLYLIGAIFEYFNVLGEARTYFVKSFVILVPLLILYYQKCKTEGCATSLLLKYSDIVTIIACISLFFWTFGSNLQMMEPNLWIPNEWGDDMKYIPSYYGVYFETQPSSFLGFEIIRNSGIFNEGPMYNMILCLALAIDIFLRQPKSKYRITILVISIISTMTTTGQLFLGILLLLAIKSSLQSRSRMLFILCIPVVLYITYVFMSTLKVDKQENATVSYDSRMSDIETCIQVGFDNPLFGVGLYTIPDGGRLNYGFSNSLFTIFAHGGFYTLLLYAGTMFLLPISQLRNSQMRNHAMVLLLYFFLFSITVSQYRYLTFLMISYSLAVIGFPPNTSQTKLDVRKDNPRDEVFA